MQGSDWFVLIAAVLAIIAVNWWFFGFEGRNDG